MRRLQSVFLILIALWLPLQSAAAVTMPFCRHAQDQLAQQQAGQMATHCHEHEQTEASSVSALGVDCDNCEMCHLATAGYLLAASEQMPPLATSILVPGQKLASASHIPEPPQQPPDA